MENLPTTYPDPVSIAIIGGTGLSSLPSPPFTPLATIPPFQTPWGLPSSPIAILSYTPAPTDPNHPAPKPITVAFLARHGLHHDLAPHEVPFRANVAALKKLGCVVAVGFSAVGSLREEVRPRDFVIVGGVVDWTKGVRPWTFFERGIVGHISMATPFSPPLSSLLHRALSTPGVLTSPTPTAPPPRCHPPTSSTVLCIEGPQFSTRSESHLYRSLATTPPINVINMSSVPECKLFAEAEIAYGLVCMSTDYDCWRDDGGEGGGGDVSVEMVMGHMAVNGGNAKRGVAAILGELWKEGEGDGGEGVGLLEKGRLRGRSRGGIMGLSGEGTEGQKEAVARLKWLFGEEWVKGDFNN
ncbi:S-methyl-5-thioadenosine phosphorylase [Lecanora helva]